MKLPKIIESIVHKRNDNREVFLSLFLDAHSIAVSFWSLGARGTPVIMANEYETGLKDSWEEKIEAIDRLLGVLEEKTGVTDVTKVILGLPTGYLSPSGEVLPEVKTEIKELARALELTPVGFVPLHQAIINKLRHDEGVPPSVILLGVNHKTIAISVYKIGSLAGLRDIEKHEDIAASVEEGLKSFTDLEVLPARMLVYGSESALEDVKSELLRHQWTTRVNFLHFPKIEVISNAFIVDSVSLAGASELGQSVGVSEVEEQQPVVPTAPVTSSVETVQAPQEAEIEEEETEDTDGTPELVEKERVEEEPEEEKVEEEVLEAQKEIEQDLPESEASASSEDANVVMVDAESLGFKKDVDVLEEEEQVKESEEERVGEEASESPKKGFAVPKFQIPAVISGFRFPSFGGQPKFIGITMVVAIILILLGGMYWFLPHATVKILEIPKSVETDESVTIDPAATVIDAQNKIIPGRKQQTTVSGDKTIPVNGKKDIGDPAKGTVTIYNKSSSDQTISKGTVLTSNALQFTLDADVTVPAATETIGGSTYGNATGTVTAVAIGPQSNLPANSQFTVADNATANAQNTQAFAGGTSKTVTVVSRADEDALVQSLSNDLIGKANQQLSSSVVGNEQLIDGTITTKITEKVFNQELDQQASQLSGKLTMTVSGISYSDTDVQAILTTLISGQMPTGYALREDKTTVSVTDVKVKKDGTITAVAHMKAQAFPTLDIATIRSAVVGKNMATVESYLRGIPGIAGIEVSFAWSVTKNSLPVNRNNITVSLSQ